MVSINKQIEANGYPHFKSVNRSQLTEYVMMVTIEETHTFTIMFQ